MASLTPDPPRAASLLPDSQPRYVTVANALAGEILDGRRAVGQMLPTEGDLCSSFGVSRSTVREALRRLRELGLVEASRGVGTRIVASQPRSNYVLAVQSVADVMGYTGPTTLEITGRQLVAADTALADRLGCAEDTRWWQVVGTRRAGARAISCVELYIAEAFEAIAHDPALVTTAAYRLIAQRLGVVVAEIKQEIGAIALDARQAAMLGSQAGQPGLSIRRRFYAASGDLLEATLNVHNAADRFSYALRLGGAGSAPG